MSDKHSNVGELAMIVIFAVVVLTLLIPRVEHFYYIWAYYQYRGIEHIATIIPFFEAETATQNRIELARSLKRGFGNYDADALAHTLQYPKMFFGGFVASIMLVFAYRISLLDPNKFVGRITLEEVELHISKYFWHGAIAIGRQLDKRHPFKSKLWRYPRKPWDFALENKIIVDLEGKPVSYPYEKMEVYIKKPTRKEVATHVFKVDAADKAFANQLGERINSLKSIQRLPNEYRILIVAILADIDQEYEDVVGNPLDWLKQATMSFVDHEKNKRVLLKGESPAILPEIRREDINMEGVDAALQVAIKMPSTRKLLLSSGYANCLIVHLFEKAFLRSSYFLWVKPINRSLWYGANNVGRPRRHHTEGLGVMAHQQFEKQAKKAQLVPKVAEATKGLKTELKRFGWIDV